MVRLRSLLNVKNVLRSAGLFFLSVGLPMLAAPALASLLFFGRRPNSDKNGALAIQAALRGVGLAHTAGAVKTLVALPSRGLVSVVAVEFASLFAFHVGNLASGRWSRAEGCTPTVLACIPVALLGAVSSAYSAVDGNMDDADGP